MKKILLLTLVMGIVFTACKNEVSEEPETKPETEIETETEEDSQINNTLNESAYSLDYIYKSDNGEIVNVTFFEEGDKMYIKVNRDGKEELILDQTTTWSKGAEYEKDNYKWTAQNYSATFSDGEETMKLFIVEPLQYRFTNEKEDITVIYFSKNDTSFVTIQRDHEPEITLEQTTAWAKGAEYGKNSVLWHAQGNKGTLIENGTESEFTQKGAITGADNL